MDVPGAGDGRDADCGVEDEETMADIVTLYEVAGADSNEIIDSADLDDLAAVSRDGVSRSLRWIVGPMLEQTARHAGPAALVRAPRAASVVRAGAGPA